MQGLTLFSEFQRLASKPRRDSPRHGEKAYAKIDHVGKLPMARRLQYIDEV